MSETQTISDAKRLVEFLTDPVVQTAFKAVARRHYERWMDLSLGPQDREALHARVCGLEDLKNEFQVMIDAGTMAVHERDAREKKDVARNR